MNLTNFYKKFIKNFNKITAFFIEQLKKINVFDKKTHRRRRKIYKIRTNENIDERHSFFKKKTLKTFETLKKTFIIAFVLRYFNSIKPLKIKTNVFNKAIDSIFC